MDRSNDSTFSCHELNQPTSKKPDRRPFHFSIQLLSLFPTMNTPNTPSFGKITSVSSLMVAWEKVRRNAGCSGADRVTVSDFDAAGPAALQTLSGRLANDTYRPGPLRLHAVPKDDGSFRQLAIPCVSDRIVQTAVAQALTPVLDPLFHRDSYGYRPGRSVQMAVDRVQALRSQGYTHVVEADIDRAFDRIPHDAVLTALTPLDLDARTTALIALWLEHGGLALGSGGRGLAQGSPLSPLLANVFLDGLDDAKAARGIQVVRFADDFLLMTRAEHAADHALQAARGWLSDHGLTLNGTGSRVVDFERGFAFLGKLFVRGLMLDAPDEPDAETQDILRDLAEEEEAANAAEAAGHDSTARVLYLTEPGRRLNTSNRSYVVEENGRPLIRLPHARVARIELGPGIEVETDTLRHALANRTALAFVDGTGETLGQLAPPEASAALHLAQARLSLDPELSTDTARRLVEARIRNMRTRLRVLGRNAADVDVAKPATELGRILRKLPRCASVAAIRGFEGRAAAVYWPCLGALCPGEPRPFRRSRPARTPLNASVNYLTALLARDIRVAVLGSGLHPGLGVLHSPATSGEACVHDLTEGFRALLTEGLAVSLFRRSRLTPQMFEVGSAAVTISPEGRRALILGYEAGIERPTTSRHSGHKVGLRRLMLEEARALAAHARDPHGRPFTAQTQDH